MLKKNKYNAKKVIVDNLKFDSKRESNRYLYLKMLQQQGLITNLELQKVFEILPGNDKFSRITYKADFVYIQDGETVVEDAKGYRKGTAYYLFTIKRKMLYASHGLVIKEV